MRRPLALFFASTLVLSLVFSSSNDFFVSAKIKEIKIRGYITTLRIGTLIENAERRSFLRLTIRNTFSDLDFSSLKKNDEEFKRIAEMAYENNPKNKKKRIKVTA